MDEKVQTIPNQLDQMTDAAAMPGAVKEKLCAIERKVQQISNAENGRRGGSSGSNPMKEQE
eukprot:9054542-Pyramimonas_sp.AAC.1